MSLVLNLIIFTLHSIYLFIKVDVPSKPPLQIYVEDIPKAEEVKLATGRQTIAQKPKVDEGTVRRGRENITVNKNAVPFDPLPPTKTSGIRIGTPAMTTRGMKEDEMRSIAKQIAKVIDNIMDEKVIEDVRKEVIELCQQFPLYPEMKEVLDELPYSKATHI